ncbi:hypothetical protein [Enorma phocaeensis]|uniref:hypothetical protein n=1 Tax=Enorma phocaeensis TaxID=1871019 RepID=UPI00195DD78F|nr:hypothetical protein [Enorma phocaeensis]MBM6953561.1 hypothetical protein [Enorma phocaeensis]
MPGLALVLGIAATVLAGVVLIRRHFASWLTVGSIACGMGSLVSVVRSLEMMAMDGDWSSVADTVGAFFLCSAVLFVLVAGLLAAALVRERLL